MRKLFIFIITYFILYFLGVLVMSITYLLDLIKFKSFNILILFSSKSFLYILTKTFFFLSLFYIFIILVYFLYINIKNKETKKMVIFSILSLIFGFFIYQFLIFLSSDSIISKNPVSEVETFKTNQFTQMCEFGFNFEWYHKKECEDYKEVKIEDSIKKEFLHNNMREGIYSFDIKKEDNKNYYSVLIYNVENFSKIYDLELTFGGEVTNLEETNKKLVKGECGESIFEYDGKEIQEILVAPSSMLKMNLLEFEKSKPEDRNCIPLYLTLKYEGKNIQVRQIY